MRALPKTAFKLGCAPGPGRPKGSRSRLSETALSALQEHFAANGMAAIERVYRERPHHYLSLIVSLLPGQVSIEKINPLGDLSDDELRLLEEYLASTRAKIVSKLEQNGAAIELEPTDTKQPEKP